MQDVAVTAPATTFARLVWPVAQGRTGAIARAACLAVIGSCLLTVSAKIQVPGPVPMTLQTLVVMALGAALGARLAVAAVALYVLQGVLGMPVFANTPPLVPGLAYLFGPTGGFLLGFAAAAGLIGAAADAGAMRSPLYFAIVLAFGNVVLMAVGFTWLALVAQTASGATGIGFAKAWAVGVQPFMLANTIKLAIAALAIPLLYSTLVRRLGGQA